MDEDVAIDIPWCCETLEVGCAVGIGASLLLVDPGDVAFAVLGIFVPGGAGVVFVLVVVIAARA